MRFLHDAGANVHIAVIIFFDMLKDGCKSTHNIRWQKKTGSGKWQRYRWRKIKLNFCWLKGASKALESLRAAGYTNIEYHKGALDAEQLKASIRDAHFIGLRSRTHLTEEVINAAEKLVAIGCFCIGTNQWI